MIEPDVKEKILKDLDRMSPELQQRASELVHSLIEPLPKGGSIEDLISFQGAIDAESLREMREAIEADREWIDPDGR